LYPDIYESTLEGHKYFSTTNLSEV